MARTATRPASIPPAARPSTGSLRRRSAARGGSARVARIAGTTLASAMGSSFDRARDLPRGRSSRSLPAPRRGAAASTARADDQHDEEHDEEDEELRSHDGAMVRQLDSRLRASACRGSPPGVRRSRLGDHVVGPVAHEVVPGAREAHGSGSAPSPASARARWTSSIASSRSRRSSSSAVPGPGHEHVTGHARQPPSASSGR